MPTHDRISSQIPAQVITDFIAKINEAMALIAPYEVNLTMDERQEMQTIGPKHVGFMERCLIHAAQTPALVADYMNASAAALDKTRRDQVLPAFILTKSLWERLDDILFLSNVDLYDFCIMIYANARERAKRNVPGADTILADLDAHYPGRRRSSPPPAPPPPPAE